MNGMGGMNQQAAPGLGAAKTGFGSGGYATNFDPSKGAQEALKRSKEAKQKRELADLKRLADTPDGSPSTKSGVQEKWRTKFLERMQ